MLRKPVPEEATIRSPLQRQISLPQSIAALLIYATLGLAARPAHADLTGRAAPDCPLTTLEGEAVSSLKNQSSHKALYVDFWASWCSSCVHAFPFMNAIHQRYGARGLRVIAINLDEKPESAKTFLARHPADFKVYAAPNAACPRNFGVEGMPASYLIDAEGMVRRVHLGFRQADAADLVAAIEKVLEPAVHQP